MTSIEEAFGTEFSSQYEKNKNAPKKTSYPKLLVTGKIREQIIQAVLDRIRPDFPQTKFTAPNGQDVDIFLVETGEDLGEKAFNWGFVKKNIFVRKKTSTDMISINSSEKELIDLVKPNSQYVLVGKHTMKPGNNGVVFRNFSLYDVISLAEIANARKEREEESK